MMAKARQTVTGFCGYACILAGYALFTVLIWPLVLAAWFVVRGKCKPYATTKKGWMND